MQRHSNVNSSYMNDTMVYFCLVATVIVPLPSLPGLRVGTVYPLSPIYWLVN